MDAMNLARFFFPASKASAKASGRAASRRAPALPRIGATVCCAQFRMTVPVGFSADLWQWLVAQGWRELDPSESRYRYRALSSQLVAALVDAPTEQRERVLTLALKRVVQDLQHEQRAAA
jgi:hypothetical protein